MGTSFDQNVTVVKERQDPLQLRWCHPWQINAKLNLDLFVTLLVIKALGCANGGSSRFDFQHPLFFGPQAARDKKHGSVLFSLDGVHHCPHGGVHQLA